jgi:4-nitrophenyl phosphatase
MQPRLILLDGDGVLWRGGSVIPEAPAFIRRAHRAGIRCALVSNNAGPSRTAYVTKCRGLGLELAAADIFSTNHLAGPYIARQHPGARVLVVGSEQLTAEMRSYCDATSAAAWLAAHGGISGDFSANGGVYKLVREARFDAVFTGIDFTVNYVKLALACVAVQHGAKLIGANMDPTFPVEDGILLPGNGSLLGLVASVCAVEPVSIGKPQLYLLEQIEAETGIGRSEMVMVGDRIETDIRFAQNAGIPAYLVLTGVTDEALASQPLACTTVTPTLDDVAKALGI